MTYSPLDGRHDETTAPETVFAIDETPDDRCPDRAIIADITRDDAWLAMDSTDTVTVMEWQ